MKKVYKIKDIEQVKLLSEPLKLQLIQAFSENEKTIKEVAVELNEKVTKLYRHIDALFDAGLIVVTNEKQKRGTIERTFKAVAERFEADHSLFTEPEGDKGINVAREVLRVCEDEIISSLVEEQNKDEEDVIIMRLRSKASPKRIKELRQSLKEWLESVQNDEPYLGDDAEEIGALIAFYRVK